jgi:hypothetical protein
VQRQLFVDNDHWIRHTDIDSTVQPEDGEQTILQDVLGFLKQATIATSLEASSHKLENSYMQQLKKAAEKLAHQ